MNSPQYNLFFKCHMEQPCGLLSYWQAIEKLWRFPFKKVGALYSQSLPGITASGRDLNPLYDSRIGNGF